MKSLEVFLKRLAGDLEIGSFSVVLISDPAIRRYNREFAGRDYATDVLSFPTSEADRGNDPYLGDIFISIEAADRQKKGSFIDELMVLSLHGVLHLIGHDHAVDDGEMVELEKTLRNKFGLN